MCEAEDSEEQCNFTYKDDETRRTRRVLCMPKEDAQLELPRYLAY
jgi:hypothetical protein